jgi:hypothetical protein
MIYVVGVPTAHTAIGTFLYGLSGDDDFEVIVPAIRRDRVAGRRVSTADPNWIGHYRGWPAESAPDVLA